MELRLSAVLPEGKDYTFWGKGVSQGHSDAIRRVEGVLDGKQYTMEVHGFARNMEFALTRQTENVLEFTLNDTPQTLASYPWKFRAGIRTVKAIADSGELVRLQGGGWAMTSAMKTTRGRLAIQRSGAAFVTPEGETAKSGKDIYIAPEYRSDEFEYDGWIK